MYCLFGRNGSVIVVFDLSLAQWVPDVKMKNELAAGIGGNKSGILKTFIIDVDSIEISGSHYFPFKLVNVTLIS